MTAFRTAALVILAILVLMYFNGPEQFVALLTRLIDFLIRDLRP